MEKECCPKFNPTPWDNKELNWQNKKFIKMSVRTFLNIPIGFGRAMTKLQSLLEKGNANMVDNLCLSDHTSKWNMDLYLAVDKEINGADNVTLSGKFYSKVYEGPFEDTGKWCKDFESIMANKSLKIKKWYMWYTTCPKCAKKYGKNYTVIIVEI